LVTKLRASARLEKGKYKRTIQKLEKKVAVLEAQEAAQLKVMMEKTNDELEDQAIEAAVKARAKTPPADEDSEQLRNTATAGAHAKPPLRIATTFETRFAELELFQKANGHSNVLFRVRGLGRWVASLRRDYRYCMKHSPEFLDDPTRDGDCVLNRERMQRLGGLGFVFDFGKVELIPWEERFAQLCEFKERFGHTKMTRTWKENPTLGEWCFQMRKKIRKNDLAKDKLQKLADLGFDWRLEMTRRTFEDRLEQCRAYRLAHGDLNIPRAPIDKATRESLDREDTNFRQWASRMRQESKKLDIGQKASIDRRQKRQLETLGFNFEMMKRGNYERGKSPGTKKSDGSGGSDQELEEALAGAASGDMESLDDVSV
jgi:hypothetical protein